MSEERTNAVACGRCNGTGDHPDFSTPDEPVECVTCQGTGEVNSYGFVKLSSGGVTVEVTAYGHRDLSEGDAERAWEGIDGDSPPVALLDRLLKEMGLRERAS